MYSSSIRSIKGVWLGGGGGRVSLQVQSCRNYFAKSATTDTFTKEMFSLSDPNSYKGAAKQVQI